MNWIELNWIELNWEVDADGNKGSLHLEHLALVGICISWYWLEHSGYEMLSKFKGQ